MGHAFVIYIDEAGDDGLGKLKIDAVTGQSRWFVVGACIVRVEHDRNIVAWRDEIASAFPNRQRRDLHFKHMNHDQRRHTCRVMASKPLRVAAALSNKITLHDLPADRLAVFKERNHLHNYLCRLLLERVSAWLKARAADMGLGNCRAKIIFSRRGGMSYEEFRDYLRLMKDGAEVFEAPGTIDWDVIDPDRVEAIDHQKRAGLQLADIATSAMFKAVEPNQFNACEHSYAEELRKVVMRRRAGASAGSAYGFGITHVPTLTGNTPLNHEQRKFFESWK